LISPTIYTSYHEVVNAGDGAIVPVGTYHAARGAPDVPLSLCPPEAILLGPGLGYGWRLEAGQWQAGLLIYLAATGRELLPVRGLCLRGDCYV
jgi:hypothetical protein